MRGQYYFYGHPATSPLPRMMVQMHQNLPAVNWIFIGLWTLFFLVLIAGLIRWIFFPRPERHHGPNHAMDILNERLAKGDITKKDYDAIKKDIE